MLRQVRHAWMLVWITYLSLPGCTAEPSVALRVGTNLWPGYAPLFMARDAGYYRGANVRLVEYASSTEVIHAFRNGAIDAAGLTLDEVLLLAQDGKQPNVSVVGVMDFSDGADVLLGAPNIRTMADLRGKRVGVEETALGGYILMRALEIAGMPSGSIRIVPLQIHEHEKAFVAGQVDAVITFDPVRTRLLERGANLLFDSRRMPHEIVDVLVVRREFIDANLDLGKKLVAGWIQAQADVVKDKKAAAARMAAHLGMKPADVVDALGVLGLPDLNENRRLLTGNPPALAIPARKLSESMHASRLLRSKVDVSHMLDPRLLPVSLP